MGPYMSSTLTETGSVVIGDASTDTLTVGATTTHNAPTTFASTLTASALTFSSGTNAQTVGQLGYTTQASNASFVMPTTNTFNNLNVTTSSAGIYIVSYGGSITCSVAPVTINNLAYGYSTNAAYNSFASNTYANVGQILQVGTTINIANSIVVSKGAAGNNFLMVQASTTTTGSGILTGNFTISATRIA